MMKMMLGFDFSVVEARDDPHPDSDRAAMLVPA
jgi:hypothetical protein